MKPMYVADPDHLPDVDYALRRNFIHEASPAEILSAARPLADYERIIRNLVTAATTHIDGTPTWEKDVSGLTAAISDAQDYLAALGADE